LLQPNHVMDTKSIVFPEKNAQSSSAKALWCNTQWANLSIQAKKFDLPTLPYFDPQTGLLSKDVNHKLWSLIEKLYNHLGPDKAPFATPVMLEGGEVEWHSFLGEDKGRIVEIYTK